MSPGGAVTGFPPGSVTAPYTIHGADAVANNALNQLTSAYNILAGRPSTADMTGQDLGGLTLTAGATASTFGAAHRCAHPGCGEQPRCDLHLQRGGAPFKVKAATPAADALLLGLGTDLELQTGLVLGVSLDSSLSGSAQSYSGNAHLAYRW